MKLSYFGKVTLATVALVFAAGCANDPAVTSQSEPVTQKPQSEPISGKRQAGERPARGERGNRPRRDMSAVAAQLGVSEDALRTAMRNAGGPPPNFEKAAAELGISAEALRSALPRRKRGERPRR